MFDFNVFIPSFCAKPVQLIDTVQVVKNTATDLIHQRGQITTLEIKNHLRLNGYNITQKEVSIIAQSIAKENNYQWTCNGQYRTYYLTA
jgi:hypothetical protein